MMKDESEQHVRVIDTQNKQLGIMTLSQAKAIAASQKLKLIGIALKAKPPVYRLVETGHPKRIEKRWSM